MGVGRAVCEKNSGDRWLRVERVGRVTDVHKLLPLLNNDVAEVGHCFRLSLLGAFGFDTGSVNKILNKRNLITGCWIQIQLHCNLTVLPTCSGGVSKTYLGSYLMSVFLITFSTPVPITDQDRWLK